VDKPNSHGENVWLAEDAGDFGQFCRLVEQQTDSRSYPLADRIISNVPIYDGGKVGANGSERKALMAEWVTVLKSGPGIVVIEQAFSDTGTIDRATGVFDTLIEQEKEAGLGEIGRAHV